MSRQARVDPLPHLEAVARAVMESGQPEPAFRALDRAMGAVIGHTLFTVLLHLIRPEQERLRDVSPRACSRFAEEPAEAGNGLVDAGQPERLP